MNKSAILIVIAAVLSACGGSGSQEAKSESDAVDAPITDEVTIPETTNPEVDESSPEVAVIPAEVTRFSVWLGRQVTVVDPLGESADLEKLNFHDESIKSIDQAAVENLIQ